ncbi:MAG: hypothetical protein Q4G68_05595 [Planctomycetia bacterium]|nr:hypothetical protein [Planctomycetia bacterium]
MKRVIAILCALVCVCLIFFSHFSAAADEMADVKQILKELGPHLQFDHAICEFEVRQGFASSIESAMAGGPAEDVRTVKVKWTFDANRKMIHPEFSENVANKSDRYESSLFVFSEGIYLTDSKYTLVIRPDIFQGAITPADRPLYLTDSYNPKDCLLMFLTSEFKTDSLGQDLGDTEKMAHIRRVKKIKQIVTIDKNVVHIKEFGCDDNDEERLVARSTFCPTTLFPCSGEIFGKSAFYFAVTDFFQCSENRFFPKRIVVVEQWNDPNDLEGNNRYQVHEYIVTKFDPDTIPTDADFQIPIPEGVGISDGEEGHASIYSEYWPDWQVVSPAKMGELYQLIQSETQKNTTSRETSIED